MTANASHPGPLTWLWNAIQDCSAVRATPPTND